jgi:SAM-dependent methyltransferase
MLKMYDELAPWWPLLSSPADYAEEAALYLSILREVCTPLASVLELGSGGGNNASHMKAHVSITLVDCSPGMLSVSRALNPDLEHIESDMRTLRLDRQFDAVFIHDAIMYMTTEDDLRQALTTAYAHCRPGGVALCVPDHIMETYQARTSHGGHDDGARGMRYLEWNWDPDPQDTTSVSEFAYIVRDGSAIRHYHERHVTGLFPRATWLRVLRACGFAPFERGFTVAHMHQAEGVVFVGLRSPVAHDDD